MKPRASFLAKGSGTSVDYTVHIRFGVVLIDLPAEGKTHAIDMVAAINREEPIDEYGRPYQTHERHNAEKSPTVPDTASSDETRRR